MVEFSIEIKNVAKTVHFYKKKTLCSSFKRKQDIVGEKNLWIRRFGIPENMSRTSYTFSAECTTLLRFVNNQKRLFLTFNPFKREIYKDGVI